MTFQASPAWICVTVTTAGSIGFTVRLGIVCSACTSALAATTGSIPSCGIAPCAPRPVTTISKMSKDAIIGPGITPNFPTGMPGQLCMPYTPSTGNRLNRPSSTIARPPPSCSSAGWKRKSTVPANRFVSARYRAAPSSIVVAVARTRASVLRLERCANVFCSWMWSASRSARSPIARVPRPARNAPTTPVFASPRCTSMPNEASFSATT
jgi:hypothetical protein